MNHCWYAPAVIFLMNVALFAQDKQAPAPRGGFLDILPMMVIMLVIIYFFMIRPQQKKQKETKEMLAAIKKGDKVSTVGGIFGTVGNVKESTVMLKIAENTVVEIKKAAIGSVLNNGRETATAKEIAK